jgi:hypothetical protein
MMTISVDWQAASGSTACNIEFEGLQWISDIDKKSGGSGNILRRMSCLILHWGHVLR